MAEGEQERFELLNSLIEVHGEDVARKLMDSLPPFSWDQVATKDDLKALSTASLYLRREIAKFKELAGSEARRLTAVHCWVLGVAAAV